MAHGVIHGVKHAPVHGPKHNVLPLQEGIVGVTRDAGSQIYVPVSSAEWTTFLTAISNPVAVPSSLWLCQEAAGNLSDSIGSLTLTAAGSPLYQQAVAGWNRLGVGLVDGTAGQRFMGASGTGPNPTTTSQTWLWLTTITTIGATRAIASISDTGATQMISTGTTAPVVRVTCVGVTTNGSANPTGAGVMPHALKYDRTNSEAKLYTGQEKVTGTYNAGVLDGRKGIGSAGTQPPSMATVYGCMWSGANGEISDANLKLLLQGMGFVISWS